ncbi:MAG: secondary thiamine-phosphate synthase enzyme YjbQ [Candidatus Bipolaricaulota bacterium]|nr:YjbQ family protein [Candidatus Bipolaricaulota bacterium]
MTARAGRAEIPIRTQAREEILDITGPVGDAVRALGITDGAVLLFCPHTTAALTVNEAADPDVRADVGAALAKLVPDLPFRHAEGNSPAHVRSALVGPSLLLPVLAGELVLGTWQGVYFCEFDGPRQRRVWAFPVR